MIVNRAIPPEYWTLIYQESLYTQLSLGIHKSPISPRLADGGQEKSKQEKKRKEKIIYAIWRRKMITSLIKVVCLFKLCFGGADLKGDWGGGVAGGQLAIWCWCEGSGRTVNSERMYSNIPFSFWKIGTLYISTSFVIDDCWKVKQELAFLTFWFWYMFEFELCIVNYISCVG